MFKLLIGSVAAAIAMFITGFLFYATPLQYVGQQRISDAQDAAIQQALASNLPKTGTYMIPDASSQAGSEMYAKGPIATVHYNSSGFSVASPNVLIAGFVHELIVCVLLAAALSGFDRRVSDFSSRAKTVVLFSLAASVFMHLGEPIWYHHDWAHFIYAFVADATMLIIAGLILARWFMPVRAELDSDAPRVSVAPAAPPAPPTPSVEQTQIPNS